MKFPVHAEFNFRDSNDTTAAKWSDPSEQFDVEACGRKGRATINVRVAGYWSMDVINLSIERKIDWITMDDSVPVWEARMSHSSGGRLPVPDEKHYPEPLWHAVKDDLEAESNFGAALMAAAQFGRAIIDNYSVVLEASYQERRLELKAIREAEEREKAERAAADQELGLQAASNLMRRACEISPHSSIVISVFERGADQASSMTVSRGNSRVTIRQHGTRMSAAMAALILAKTSHRTCIA